MDQPLVIAATLASTFIACLALISIPIGIIEISFFRQRVVGLTENQRKQYITNVIKVILTTGAASLAAIVLVVPGFAQQTAPGIPNYTPALTLIVVIVAALVTYRLELASESPDTLYDLHSDLRKSWMDEEDLKRHAIARRRAWLRDFMTTNGGRSMVSSKRALNTAYQTAIDEALDHDYTDMRFKRLARLTTFKTIVAMIRGHVWRSLWLLTPLFAVLFSWLTVLLLWTPDSTPDVPALLLLGVGTLALGCAFSYFNFWARSTARLKRYCELKRYEELCDLLLTKLARASTTQKAATAEAETALATSEQVAALSSALEAHLQTNSPGIIRRALQKLW
ncbi:UNVERIFIED_CONTAM: hypothetical protein ABIE34_000595 [Jeotgalibacillus campisalis]